MSLVDTQIGSITLEAVIGRGGMGEVYRGSDRKLGRTVAVKTIRRDGGHDAELRARFEREARILGKLGHPGICQVFELIETAGADFLVLEFIDGVSLRERIASPGFDRPAALAIARDIAAALAVAHREGIVHRDLKPDNVMITHGGTVKILDFGIARVAETGDADAGDVDGDASVEVTGRAADIPDSAPELRDVDADAEIDSERTTPSAVRTTARWSGDNYVTEVGTVLGTRRYMSPEQSRGASVGPPSDMYSFGVLLEEMIYAIERRQKRDGVAVPPRDAETVALLAQLQSYGRDRRPDAPAAVAALEALLDRPRREAQRRRRRLLLAVAGALLLAAVGVTSMLAVLAQRARQEAETRRVQAETLIDFMLGDLRGKLEGVGRLDLLKDVNDHAMQYFDGTPPEALSPREIALRVKHLQQIADVRLQSGDAKQAQLPVDQAIALARAELARHPDSVASQVALAECESWLGYVGLEQEVPTEQALAHFRAALDWAERAARTAPGDIAVIVQLASTYNNVGAAETQIGRHDEAIATLGRSIEFREKSLAAPGREATRDEDRALLAAALGWRSSALEALARYDEALADRRRQVELLRAARQSDASNKLHGYDLTIAQRYLADLLAVTGDDTGRADVLRDSAALALELAASDPGNASWQRNAALLQSRLGEFLLEHDDLPAARKALDTAVKMLEDLATREADNREYPRLIAVAEARRARAAGTRDAAATARRIEAAIARFEANRVEGEAAGSPNLVLAQLWKQLGDARREGGDRKAALAAWDAATAALPADLDGSRDWRPLLVAAELAERRGDSARAIVLAERLAAMNARPGALLALCRRLSCPTASPTESAP